MVASIRCIYFKKKKIGAGLGKWRVKGLADGRSQPIARRGDQE
jgi:hypothetical protein